MSNVLYATVHKFTVSKYRDNYINSHDTKEKLLITVRHSEEQTSRTDSWRNQNWRGLGDRKGP